MYPYPGKILIGSTTRNKLLKIREMWNRERNISRERCIRRADTNAKMRTSMKTKRIYNIIIKRRTKMNKKRGTDMKIRTNMM